MTDVAQAVRVDFVGLTTRGANIEVPNRSFVPREGDVVRLDEFKYKVVSVLWELERSWRDDSRECYLSFTVQLLQQPELPPR